MITLPYYSDLNRQYASFYNELTKNSLVHNASRSSRIPTGRLLDSYGSASVVTGDSLKPVNVNLKSISTDEEFFSAYGIGLAAGRTFSKSIPTDDSLAFIINETAASRLGWKNPSAEIDKDFQYAGVRGKLVGIVKDFILSPCIRRSYPWFFSNGKITSNRISVKLSGKEMQDGIAYVEKVWKEFLPTRRSIINS